MAQSGHSEMSAVCPLSGGKADMASVMPLCLLETLAVYPKRALPGLKYRSAAVCDLGVIVSRCCGGPTRLTADDRPRSNALEDLRASHPYHATIRGDVCCDPSRSNCCRADDASRPYRRYSAV